MNGFRGEVDDEWEDDPCAEEETIQKEGLLDGSAGPPLLHFLADDLLATACSLAAQERFPALDVLVDRYGTILFLPASQSLNP